MVNSISSASAAPKAPPVQQHSAPKPHPPAAQAAQTRDTVSLSHTALASLQSGDVDHDGDSH